MMYKHYLLILMLFSFFKSCKENNNNQNYDLKNLRATIKIPKTYQPVNKERLDRIYTKNDDVEFKNHLLNLSRINPDQKYLIDTLDPHKFIIIRDSVSYLEMDFIRLSFLIDQEKSRSVSKHEMDDSIYFVGSKFDSTVNFKFMELKYKTKSGVKKGVVDGFVISSDKRSTAINFYAPKEENVLQYIRTIQRNKLSELPKNP